MDTSALDSILALQLAVGRLGEKELCGWWNVDLVHRLGGADFLQRLADARMAPLAAGEGLLLAAGKAEDEKLAGMPQGIATLFRPAAAVQVAIYQRWRHFKAWPEDLPEALARLLNPDTDWTVPALVALRAELCAGVAAPATEATAFGRELAGRSGRGVSMAAEPAGVMSEPAGSAEFAEALELAKALALCYDPADKGRLILPYCRIAS